MADAKTEVAAPKGGKGKLMIFAILGVVLLLGGGGAAWFLMQGGNAEAKPEEHAAEGHGDHHDSGHGDSGHGEEDAGGDHGHRGKKHSEDDEYEDGAAEESGGGGGGHGEEGAGVPGANYLALDPPFVVNFATEPGKKPRARFLKIEVQCLTRTPGMLEVVKAHAPLIRNRLILLFSGQKYEDLATPAGIEALRVAALEEVRDAMKEVTGKKTVKDLFFTSFVMQ